MVDAVPKDPPERVKYAVLGCGSTGYNVVQELVGETRSILVVDREESRVSELRDQNFNAVAGDITSESLLATLPVFEIAFVLTSDHATNLAAIKAIRNRLSGVHVVARAADPISAGVLGSSGADYVLYPPNVVARAAIHQINKLHANRISRRLHTLLSGWEGTLAIITHKNPDPDAISSAMALATIAASANPKKLTCRIF
ncbi:MAG: NAD-binding protein, partial [Methanoregulaceae archaeon]